MFKPPQNQREQAQGAFTGSVALLANVLAFATALLATPLAYRFSAPTILTYLTNQYGAAWHDLFAVLWGLIIAIAVFAFARASLATAITLGGFAIAARIF